MKRLFVAMPYGTRRAPLDQDKPEETCEIDFDAVWAEVLQPAIPHGFEAKRADELRRPGLIDRLYNELLFDADIVLADLTFGNPNVYYELGIRQALSKKGTVLVACKGTSLPFDVRGQNIIYYNYFAAPALRQFQLQLRQSIESVASEEVDSPVHTFLPGLVVGRYQGQKPPEVRVEELTRRIEELEDLLSKRGSRDEEKRLIRKLRGATSRARVLSLYKSMSSRETASVDLLEQIAIKLRQFSHFDEALQVLDKALRLNSGDSEILREIGFVYRKKGPDFYVQAESYLEKAIQLNDADAEAHGMLGGLLKRRGSYEQALAHYRVAHEAEPKNIYPLAALAGMCGALGMTDEALKLYQKLRALCQQLINRGKGDHWAYLCLGEASVALGDQEAAMTSYQKAIAQGPPIEDLRSAAEQLEFLREMNFAAEASEYVLPVLRERLDSEERTAAGVL